MNWLILELLDVITTGNTWVAKVLSARRNKFCFILFSTTAVYWIFRNYFLGLYAMPIVGIINILINIYGFINWGKKEHV